MPARSSASSASEIEDLRLPGEPSTTGITTEGCLDSQTTWSNYLVRDKPFQERKNHFRPGMYTWIWYLLRIPATPPSVLIEQLDLERSNTDTKSLNWKQICQPHKARVYILHFVVHPPPPPPWFFLEFITPKNVLLRHFNLFLMKCSPFYLPPPKFVPSCTFIFNSFPQEAPPPSPRVLCIICTTA